MSAISNLEDNHLINRSGAQSALPKFQLDLRRNTLTIDTEEKLDDGGALRTETIENTPKSEVTLPN